MGAQEIAQGEKKLQSSKTLSKSFQKVSGEKSLPEALGKIRLGNRKYKNRPDRLDLLSHDILGITAQVGSKSYSLCDISEKGFSYGQHIPASPAISFPNLWRKADQVALALHGKTLPFIFSFKNKTKESLQVVGMVRNHRMFIGLQREDVEREIHSFMFKRGIRPDKDPQGFFAKADAILNKAKERTESGLWDAASMLALNMSMINLFEELGASERFFDELWMGYERRPLFLKFGISVDDPMEARKLFYYAQNKKVVEAKDEKEAGGQGTDKEPFLAPLNTQFPAKKFLPLLWKNALRHFGLEESRLVLPQNEEERVALLTELKQKPLQELFDADYSPQPSLILEYLTTCIHCLAIEEDPRWLKRQDVLTEMTQLSQRIVEAVLKRLGWQKPTGFNE